LWRFNRRWHLAAALRRRCFAQLMHEATSWIVVESTAWIARRNRQVIPRFPPARTNEGHADCKCLSIAQNSFSAIAQSRTLFAWLSVFLAGGRAARTLKSEPARSLQAWLICAYSIVTTWLHALYVRLFSSTPVSRA